MAADDKHKLVIYEKQAMIVRRIFKEFLSGKSMYKIATKLNDEGINPPGLAKALRDGTQSLIVKYKNASSVWSTSAVRF